MDIMRLSHAYIADGTDVDNLAMAAVCSADGDSVKPCKSCKHCDKAVRHIHPDIISIKRLKGKDGKLRQELIVSQIRELKRDAYIAPNEAARKAYIICEAHLMNANAQNAFLLMLEEPPPHVVFILQTPTPHTLLPTVRSRCVTFRGQHEALGEKPVKIDEIRQLADNFAEALDSNMRLTQCMFRIDKLDRQEFTVFIDLARESLSPALRDKGKRDKSLKALELLGEAGTMLDMNVSAGHISGMLCAGLME